MRTALLLLAFALLPGSASPQTSGKAGAGRRPLSTGRATHKPLMPPSRLSFAATTRAPPSCWSRGSPTGSTPMRRRRSSCGLLYENGLGVPLDRSRACALFARATESQGPFMQTAQELTRLHLDMAGPDPVPDCQMLMNWGLRHGFAPARFTLASDHWVAIDISPRKREIVAIVGYRGREKESAFSYGPSMGAIYLPTIYTSLPGPGEGAAARHFVEVSHWLPVGPSQWQLLWSLAEVGDGRHRRGGQQDADDNRKPGPAVRPDLGAAGAGRSAAQRSRR